MTQRYWFKRRRYGYGWTPVTTAGWLTVASVLVVAVGGALLLPTRPDPRGLSTAIYLVAVGAAIGGLLIAGCVKGPKPGWRWGSKPDDDPDEDF